MGKLAVRISAVPHSSVFERGFWEPSPNFILLLLSRLIGYDLQGACDISILIQASPIISGSEFYSPINKNTNICLVK